MSRMGRYEIERIFDRQDIPPTREAHCKFCGSEDVRWRQQGGKWTLFSLMPGVEHRCVEQSAPNTDGFGPVSGD